MRTFKILGGGVVVALLAMVLTPAVSLACKEAGAFKHVGIVTTVDAKAMTLTIKDAETGGPIVFSVTAAQLKGIKAGDQILVGYTEEKSGTLTAVQIQA